VLKLKRTVIVGAMAAGALALGVASASAAQGDSYPGPGHHGHSWAHEGVAQYGLINLNNIDISPALGLCGNNVGVLGAAVPILSPTYVDNCASVTQVKH
jgi:hypothetical protein